MEICSNQALQHEDNIELPNDMLVRVYAFGLLLEVGERGWVAIGDLCPALELDRHLLLGDSRRREYLEKSDWEGEGRESLRRRYLDSLGPCRLLGMVLF